MDVREIVIGFVYLVIANLCFFLTTPLWSGLMASLAVGQDLMVTIGWGMYVLCWGILGIAIPLYMFIKGASSN